MLACAACAREKQHLLGQQLKEIQIKSLAECHAKHGLKPLWSLSLSSHCLIQSQSNTGTGRLWKTSGGD